jgi:hypothetical protein
MIISSLLVSITIYTELFTYSNWMLPFVRKVWECQLRSYRVSIETSSDAESVKSAKTMSIEVFRGMKFVKYSKSLVIWSTGSANPANLMKK